MRAATVLGIQDGDYVNIFYDEQQLAAGRLRIYIGKSSAGIMARKDGHCLVLNSRPLAHKLSALLESEGSYRICPEDSVELNGNTYYNIFFKVYDKENSIKGN